MAKFGLKKLQTSLYGTIRSIFRHLQPFRCGSRVWRTDGRTNGRTVKHCRIVALQYVERPETCSRQNYQWN